MDCNKKMGAQKNLTLLFSRLNILESKLENILEKMKIFLLVIAAPRFK